MKHLFKEIEKSLNEENYYAALFMILTVPNICLSVKMNKRLGIDYINWFNENMPPKYIEYMSSKDYYALRCAILHEGTDSVLGHG